MKAALFCTSLGNNYAQKTQGIVCNTGLSDLEPNCEICHFLFLKEMDLDNHGYDVSSTLAGKGEQINVFSEKHIFLAQSYWLNYVKAYSFFNNFPTISLLPPSSTP